MPEFQAIAASKATTMGHIQRGHLAAAETVVPGQDLIEAADRILSPIFDCMLSNSLESRTLAQVRDLLLPKLMSGEIQVKDPEQAVNGAV